MKKYLPNLIVLIAGTLLVIYFTIKFPVNTWSVLFVGLMVNVIAAPVTYFIFALLFNMKKIPLFIQTKFIYRNSDIRMSISYLFRIQAKGKYLLVKNRNGNYYQLVGGAYKRYITTEDLFRKYHIKSDRRFETSHGIAKNDLRFHIPGKHVFDILKWFNAKVDREISQWREFCEELLTTKILPAKEFRYIDYKYIDTLQTPLQKARNLDCQEILIYEIYDLIANEEQAKILEELCDRGDTDQYKWADAFIINALGYNESNKEYNFQIGAHTKWALNMEYSYE